MNELVDHARMIRVVLPEGRELDVRGVLLPGLVLLAGVAASTTGTWWISKSIDEQAKVEFARIVQRSADEISDRFRRPVYGLAGAGGVYATHAKVTRDSFRRYVASRNLPVEFPGVRDFGFIQPLACADLPAFAVGERADGAPEFAVHQLWPQDDDPLYVVEFIEPYVQNAAALGLDMGTESVRRLSLLRTLAGPARRCSGQR